MSCILIRFHEAKARLERRAAHKLDQQQIAYLEGLSDAELPAEMRRLGLLPPEQAREAFRRFAEKNGGEML